MGRKYITVSASNDAWGEVIAGSDFDSTREARKICEAAREHGLVVYLDQRPSIDDRQDGIEIDWWSTWCGEGYMWGNREWSDWFARYAAISAQDFADTLQHPVVFFAGVGCPAGQHIALLESTELPFSLADLEGEVQDEIFEANNLDDEHGWKFVDWQLNTIYKLQVFDDEDIWNHQNDDE